MVFQSYALFPHMTVAENVAYGLKMRGIADGERRPAWRRWSWCGLAHLGAASPRALRRPAAARGPGPRHRGPPHVILLDEPLSNLDARLRMQMRPRSADPEARPG